MCLGMQKHTHITLWSPYLPYSPSQACNQYWRIHVCVDNLHNCKETDRGSSPDSLLLSRPRLSALCPLHAEGCTPLLKCVYPKGKPDVTIIIHMRKPPRLSLHYFYLVKSHILCALTEKGEPGNDAKLTFAVCQKRKLDWLATVPGAFHTHTHATPCTRLLCSAWLEKIDQPEVQLNYRLSSSSTAQQLRIHTEHIHMESHTHWLSHSRHF